MAKETILAVDDEEDILELIRYNLDREGYVVRTVRSGEEALRQIALERPDLVLLDLMLPGVDGRDVCKSLKRDPKTAAVPVVMLTARTEDVDIVSGLELGADDYITKPFSPKVLIARVRAVIRRAATAQVDTDGLIKVHGLRIDLRRHEASFGEMRFELSATEFAILVLLARSPGWVFSRSKIIDSVKGHDYPVTERSVDVQILGLRKKLGKAGEFIQTVRGVGYRLEGPTVP